MWERFEFMVLLNRFNSRGELSFPEYWKPFEGLYHDLKMRYPRVEGWPKTPEELQERRKLRELNVFSKMAPP